RLEQGRHHRLRLRDDRVSRVAGMKPERIVDGVHRILKGYVNAYLIEADDGLTIVDTGMPKKLERILQGVRALGHGPGDLRTILIPTTTWITWGPWPGSPARPGPPSTRPPSTLPSSAVKSRRRRPTRRWSPAGSSARSWCGWSRSATRATRSPERSVAAGRPGPGGSALRRSEGAAD